MIGVNQTRIKELLDYNQDTGVFVWKVDRGNQTHAGDIAGNFTHEGYKRIKVDGKEYKAHRLAWMYVYGTMTEEKQIDHVNHDRSDNRIKNLRLVTHSSNQKNRLLNKNNTTGVCGVRKRGNRFIAELKHNGVSMHLGSYDNFFDAVAARKSAQNVHNFHSNHGGVL